MTSAGGLVPVDVAAELPAALLLSGPAGGVRAAAAVAVANGVPDAITFDMGGTSTDVCLVLEGAPDPGRAALGRRLLRALPALDIHTIGAGGGSIASLDVGGALVVGPRSAGAEPGPACYGRGGTEPTVTDADLVAGRLPDERRLRRPSPGPRTGRAGAGPGRRRRRRACSRWWTPRWSGRCDRCRSSAASTLEASPSSPSVAPDRCTLAPSPTRSRCRRSSCRPGQVCCRQWGC